MPFENLAFFSDLIIACNMIWCKFPYIARIFTSHQQAKAIRHYYLKSIHMLLCTTVLFSKKSLAGTDAASEALTRLLVD